MRGFDSCIELGCGCLMSGMEAPMMFSLMKLRGREEREYEIHGLDSLTWGAFF